MSAVDMTVAAEGAAAQTQRAASNNWVRLARPALELVLPVTLGVVWEFVVRVGWASGRLAPPPSVIFTEFVDLARSGDEVIDLPKFCIFHGGHDALGIAHGGPEISCIDEKRLPGRRHHEHSIAAFNVHNVDVQILRGLSHGRPGNDCKQ